MNFEMWLTLAILVVTIFLFITEWIRVDVVALGVVVSLMATGILTTTEALSGFSNPAVLTIAALFIVGGGVLQTGLAGTIGRQILKIAGTNSARLMVVVMLTVALLSGFMSDTGTVAVLLPAIISLSQTLKINPSKLLIPLSYGALLGGATTLIGTTPNIIASDLLGEAGFEPFSFFDFTPIGLALLAGGIGYMLLVGRRMLPDRQAEQFIQEIATPEELVDLYRLPDDLYRLRVRRYSNVEGRSLSDLALTSNYGITVIDILRNPDHPPVFKPLTPQQTLLQDDVLVVKGKPEAVARAAAELNLGVQPASEADEASLVNLEVGIAEILIPPRSGLLGKTIVEARFGSTYRLTVLDVRGSSASGRLDMRNTPLRFGDILLVQGPWENIMALRSMRRDFVVMGEPEGLVAAPMRRRAPYALLILAGLLLLLVGEVFPVAAASMIAALLMILTGCLTIDDAYNAIDWKSVVLIAGMLPMSIALENVGLVDAVATGLTQEIGDLGPTAVLAILFLVTSLLTQVLSNTATTVLLAPIAFATAGNLGVQPQPLLMAIAIAASMGFASPVASPTNTLVLGAGNYRFGDFLKIGSPLILLALIISVLIVPLIFPF
jgi:di/tricarboxylate transporter